MKEVAEQEVGEDDEAGRRQRGLKADSDRIDRILTGLTRFALSILQYVVNPV